MREDLVPGNPFPDLRCPTHGGGSSRLARSRGASRSCSRSSEAGGAPRSRSARATSSRFRTSSSVSSAGSRRSRWTSRTSPAFRAGLGADFPFLTDEDRSVAEELDLLELTDETTAHPAVRSSSTRSSGSTASGAASGTGATRRPRSSFRRSGRSRGRSSRHSTRRRCGRGRRGGSRRRHRRRCRLDPRELRGTGALARRPPRRAPRRGRRARPLDGGRPSLDRAPDRAARTAVSAFT